MARAGWMTLALFGFLVTGAAQIQETMHRAVEYHSAEAAGAEQAGHRVRHHVELRLANQAASQLGSFLTWTGLFAIVIAGVASWYLRQRAEKPVMSNKEVE